jgi:hypothetical protein
MTFHHKGLDRACRTAKNSGLGRELVFSARQATPTRNAKKQLTRSEVQVQNSGLGQSKGLSRFKQ